jgi:hypothetical protein
MSSLHDVAEATIFAQGINRTSQP